MSFIERAAKRLEDRHPRARHPGAPAGRTLDLSSSRLRQLQAESERPDAEADLEAGVIDIAGLGEASTGGSRVNQRLLKTALDEETLIPKPADVIDEEDPAEADRPEPHFSADADSDLNDEALGQDDVDTYTGAVFRNSTDRVRAAHVRALRAKIDQVEASVDEASVSMPPAPVRAARAGLGATAARNDDQPPVLSMRDVVRDSALIENAPVAAPAADSAPESAKMQAGVQATDTPADSGSGGTADAGSAVAVTAAVAATNLHGTGGKLNLKSIRAQAYLDPEGREDRMREAFEPIADDLLEQMAADAAATTPMGRRIMVTSAEHGVGRSLCGVHLALSLAVDHGQSVCYIDLDFSGAPIVPTLGVRAGAGVADWLDGQVQTIDALVVPTELATLKLIAPGSAAAVGRRAKRLDRQSMNAFLLAYSARHPEDLVVMGAPALSDEWNATMLAGPAGQVVVVVEANKTPRKQLVKALDALQRHSRVSLMLNKMNR